MDKITFFYGRLDETSKYHWLPLCFPLLSAYLDLGKVEVVVIDERIEQEETFRLINHHVPQSIFFGVSSYTGFQLSRSIQIAKYVKEKFPKIPIVWGGSHVTALPEVSLKEDFVDLVFVNRGETQIKALIKGLKENTLDNIPGVYFKKKSGIIGTPNCNVADFHSLPPWPYEILKIEKYLNPKTMILNLTTSWGCSNKCTFCFWYRNFNPWSAFSADRVFDTVKYFKEKYGIKRVCFNEANSFLDIKRAIEIARKLRPLYLKYLVTARIDELSKISSEQFKFLEETGLSSIFIGLESASPRILKLMNKRINLEDAIVIAKNMRNINITLFVSLIFQVPDETIEDLKITYKFVQKLKKINSNIRIQTVSFVPLPNLPLTRLAVKSGFKIPQSMNGWAGVILRTRLEKKPWLSDKYMQEYKKVFNEFFPESQTTVYED